MTPHKCLGTCHNWKSDQFRLIILFKDGTLLHINYVVYNVYQEWHYFHLENNRFFTPILYFKMVVIHSLIVGD